MKKIYERPLLEVIELKAEDIIRTSLNNSAKDGGSIKDILAGEASESFGTNFTSGGTGGSRLTIDLK